jgi:hypothetical protein
MAKNLADLQTKVLAVKLSGERRGRRVVIIAVVGVAAIGAAAYFATGAMEAKDTAAAAQEWSQLSTCLLGDAPLGERETASSRVRNVQLAVMGLPKEKRSKGTELPWPQSCAPVAHSLAEHLKAAGDAKKSVATSAEAVAKLAQDNPSATKDMAEQVDKLWKEAAAAGLKAGGPAAAASGSPVAAAPKPAAPWSGDQFKDLPKFLSGGFSLSALRIEPSPGASIRFLVDQKDLPEGPVSCSVSATDAAIRCGRVPPAAAALSPALRLVGTTDDGARPFLFGGDRGQLGIFSPDGGDKLAAAVALGGTAHADGSILLATKKDSGKDVRFFLQPKTGAATERGGLGATDLDAPGQVGVFFDWVMWRAKPSAAGAKTHLLARKPETATGTDIGELDDAAPTDPQADEDGGQLTGCKSGASLVARVRGAKNDALSFLAGDKWGAPVKAPFRGGALTCNGTEAMITRVATAMDGDKNAAAITQAKCSAAACTQTQTSMKEIALAEILPADANGITAVDIGGKLLVVWNAGYLGGLRARIAPIDRIKDAEDIVLYDGRDESSKHGLSTILGVRGVSNGAFGLVFVHTTQGVRALRFDGAGKYTVLPSGV